MLRITIILLALAVLLGLLFGPWDLSDDPSPVMPSSAEDQTGLWDAPGDRLEPAAPATEPKFVRTEVPAEDEAPTPAAPLECVVRGRVVDEEGEPLASVPVHLLAYGIWAEGVEVPRLDGPYDMRGFEVDTDSSGAFCIEAPVPTARGTTLSITPDRFHDSYRVDFETGRSRSQPSLIAGERDLGEIRLATTGAVRGRVTAADGRPLDDVWMGVGPDRSSTYGRNARTGGDGTYTIEHAPVGTYAVKAKAEGYLSGYLEPVTVEAWRDTTGIDFVLAVAPTLEGIVVDERGAPIEGVKLWGWPASSGSGAGADSDADGGFVVYLPQDEPYSLSAKADGYQTWDSRSITYPPGSRDLEIVMHSIPRTRFAVVDAETGEPVVCFGLNILEDNGSQAPRPVRSERRPPTPREHPGGIAEATARPGIDLYIVAAEGYLVAIGDVAHDTSDEPLQTVRMRRGSTLRGRVLRDGEAVVGTRVEVDRGGGIAGRAFRADRHSLRSTLTDAQGRFEVTALAVGEHRLTVRPDDGAPLVLVPLPIVDGEVLDVGDLILIPGAAIAGEVLSPPGIDPAGLHVYLDDWRQGVKTVVDAQGRFRFENLAAGMHIVTLDDRPGVLAGSEAVEVELVSGETLPVTLDARDRAMCAVTLTLDLPGAPVQGLRVALVSTEDPREHKRIGATDGQGIVTGSARAWGETMVRMYLPHGSSVEHPEVRLDLQPGGRVTETVRFEFARVELSLPSGIAFPEDGVAALRLTSATTGQNAQTVVLRFAEGNALVEAPEFARAAPGRLSFGGLLPGRVELTLELTDDAAELERIPLGGRSFRIQKPSYYHATQEVVLVADETLAIQLR